MDPATEYHPAGYPWSERFPDAETLSRGEGWRCFAARGEGAFWIIVDEGTLADFLPEDERDGLICLERFSDESAWTRRRVEVSSRVFGVRVEGMLRRYLEEAPGKIEQEVGDRKLSRINERDHLQPWSRELLTAHLPRGYRTELRTSQKLAFPEHWPRLGDVDIVLDEPQVAPAFLELKCGAGSDSLGPCAWDLLKLALCIRQSECSAGYLVAATQARWFEEGKLGCELLDGCEWQAIDIRDRYASWFRHWEPKDPPILKVPDRGSVEPLGSCSFAIEGAPWMLQIARVKVVGDGWYSWEQFIG